MRRTRTIPAIAALLGVAAIGATTLLQQHAEAGHDAQLELKKTELALTALQHAPFRASTDTGGSPEEARSLIAAGNAEVTTAMAKLNRESPPAALSALPPLVDTYNANIERIFELGVSDVGYQAEADALAGENAGILVEASGPLGEAGREYEARSTLASRQATVGGAAAILLLFAGFAFYYVRSARNADEKQRLLAKTREESITDALTGLNNRRALMDDLGKGLAACSSEDSLLLTLLDLDGFKQYNDTFGHPAGDILLARLGGRLTEAIAESGTVYRMGGDEFCMLTTLEGGDDPDRLSKLAAEALSDAGEGFEIGCSYGVALAQAGCSSPEQMLQVADQRMYASKAGRSSASRQSTDVLLQVLSERDVELSDHGNAVAALAGPVAERLGLSEAEVKRTHLAAELHDIGKSGIPDAILGKEGPLDDEEWKFMQRHTLIGERIILAAPSLAPAADLVRFSHERFDGKGYPDGLAGDQIPLGARIIFACDAFHAMTAERPYRAPMSVAAALDELRHCAGTQFDPAAVEVLCALIDEREAAKGSDQISRSAALHS